VAGEHRRTAASLLEEMESSKGYRERALLLGEANVHATLHLAECLERLLNEAHAMNVIGR
jgi:hypothetical protein